MGIFCGLPSKTGRLSTFHFDEYVTFDALSKMNPSKLDFYPSEVVMTWGTFQVYTLGFVLKTMEMTGLLKINNKEDLKNNLYMADRIYIAGRLINIFFSCLSILMIFLISRKILNGYYSLIPPLFFSLSYVEIYISSLVKPDVIMIFWGLCSLYFNLKNYIEEFSNKNLLLAAIFNGLSFITKYTGIVFAFPFIFLSFYKLLKEKKINNFFKLNIIYFSLMFIILIIINPYFILRNSDVIKSMSVSFSKTYINCNIFKGYFNFFSERMPVSIGWPLWIFSIFSIIYSFISRRKELIFMSLFTLFYILKFEHSCRNVITYSLPLIPFFAILAGYFFQNFFPKKFLYKVLFILIFFYTGAYSFYQKSLWNDNNTLQISSLWIENNIKKTDTVCLSRVDVWTPVVLRKYNTPYNLYVASKPNTTFEYSINSLTKNLDRCDFIVLSEFEKITLKEMKEGKDIEEKINANFELIKEFKRPRNPIFVLFESPHYLTADIVNPDIFIFKKR